MNRIAFIALLVVLYVAFDLVLSAVGVSVGWWQYWALRLIVVAISLLSMVHLSERKAD